MAGLDINTENMKQMSNELSNSPGKLFPFHTDISKESEIIKTFTWIEENLGPIHILINNAAIIKQTTLIEGSTKIFKDVFDVNVIGLCVATREAVKSMRKNRIDGHIIHMNSIGGHRVTSVANANVYYATKHSVTALTETLRQELISIGSKIKITVSTFLYKYLYQYRHNTKNAIIGLLLNPNGNAVFFNVEKCHNSSLHV